LSSELVKGYDSDGAYDEIDDIIDEIFDNDAAEDVCEYAASDDTVLLGSDGFTESKAESLAAKYDKLRYGEKEKTRTETPSTEHDELRRGKERGEVSEVEKRRSASDEDGMSKSEKLIAEYDRLRYGKNEGENEAEERPGVRRLADEFEKLKNGKTARYESVNVGKTGPAILSKDEKLIERDKLKAEESKALKAEDLKVKTSAKAPSKTAALAEKLAAEYEESKHVKSADETPKTGETSKSAKLAEEYDKLRYEKAKKTAVEPSKIKEPSKAVERYDGLRIEKAGAKVEKAGIESARADLSAFDELRAKIESLADELDKLKQKEARYKKTDEKEDYELVKKCALIILKSMETGSMKQPRVEAIKKYLSEMTPNNWLVSALISVFAWLGDERELAEYTLKDAFTYDMEKTLLFFTLFCLRVGRADVAKVWLGRYLKTQDPFNMRGETLTLLGAYVSGTFGEDETGECFDAVNEWMTILSSKPGYDDKQKELWSGWLKNNKLKIDDSEYKPLAATSGAWPEIKETAEWAGAHKKTLEALKKAVETPSTSAAYMEARLDGILYDLIEKDSDSFDDNRVNFAEELPVIAMGGDKFGVSSDIRKLAVKISKSWIYEAYEDLNDENFSLTPKTIPIQISDWAGSTKKEKDVKQLKTHLDHYYENMLTETITGIKLDLMYWVSFFAGVLIVVLGTPTRNPLMIVGGVVVILYWVYGMALLKTERDKAAKQIEQLRLSAAELLQNIVADLNKYRAACNEGNEYYDQVVDYINGI
jgi:hypothetical protein